MTLVIKEMDLLFLLIKSILAGGLMAHNFSKMLAGDLSILMKLPIQPVLSRQSLLKKRRTRS
jgi:hypothetical protein